MKIRGTGDEQLTVVLSETGNVYCPVCGYELQTRECNNIETYMMFMSCSCRCCGTLFGKHDKPVIATDASSCWSTQEAWDELRAAWLEREGFSESVAKQVQDHLGLQVDVPGLGTKGNSGKWIYRYREIYRKGVPLGEWNKCMLNRETKEFLIKYATGPQAGLIQASGTYRDIRFGQTLRMMESRPDRYFIDPPDEIVWR